MSKQKKATKVQITNSWDTVTTFRADPKPLKIFIAVFPFLIGGYYEWASCMASIVLLGYLLYCYKVYGKMYVFRSMALLTSAVIIVAYGISVFWAVDSGMAVFGVVKYLPVLIFVISLEQVDQKQRGEVLNYVPVSGAVMTVASGIFSLIPEWNDFFTVNNRLAGFFQYPNTFALFLLAGIIVLLSKEIFSKRTIIILLILFAGVILTGSRTGFILLVVTVLCFCFFLKDKRIRVSLAAWFIFIVAAAGIYVFATGNTSSVGRFLTTSFSTSTFLGRILYIKDALPVILTHPFGLGYMGYYYTQGSFQTGVYTVVNVHNELLQMALDVGWIPPVIFLWMTVRAMRYGNLQSRFMIAGILLHSLLDFNLQFLSIAFVLFTSVESNEKWQSEFIRVTKSGSNAVKARKKERRTILISAGIIGCVSLYFGVASGLYYIKQYSPAAVLYPGYTNAWMQILMQTDEVQEMEETADRILVMNPTNPLANNARARVAYARGDFGNVINYKRMALEYYRYNLEEYTDYFNMLYVGYQLYTENGDRDSASICAEQMQEIPNMLEEVKKETDPLAYRITDKPELELPDEYMEILNMF